MKQINSQKLQDTLRKKFLKSGVKMSGPETIFFSNDTKIGKRVIIEPYVVLGQKLKLVIMLLLNLFHILKIVKLRTVLRLVLMHE